jgi:hypothetical protein
MQLPEHIRLSMWAGYRAGARAKASDGEMQVHFHGARATDRQRDALEATRKRATTMKAVLLDAIVAAYPTFREWKRRPKSITRPQLKERTELWEILLSKDHHQGVAYVAYVFSCAWDPSGVYVLTHGDRVVAAGGSEVLGYPHQDPLRTTPKPAGPTLAQRRAARAAAEKRAKKNPKALPPDHEGELWLTLPVWAGFFSGPGSKASNGVVGVSVGGDATDAEEIGPEQRAAYRRIVGRAHARAAQRMVLDAIVASFPKLTKGATIELPEKVDRAALESLLKLTAIHIHWAHRNKVAYVGYELRGAWDTEHGVGVMTHEDRVVAVGQADTAILGWVAERDRKKSKA